MSAKLLKFDTEARAKLLIGIEKVEEAVASTLSPKGRNVALDKGFMAPHNVHDGVTVAREIELEDKFENMGAQMVKEAAGRTNDIAGDGTTTATILTAAVTREGFKAVEAGANPMTLKKGIEKATDALVEELKKVSKKITTPAEKRQVAVISAQDEVIGEKIEEAITHVGMEGVVTVEESRLAETTVEYREGMEYDRGAVSPYFITDEERLECMVEEPYILITDSKLDQEDKAVAILEKLFAASIRNIVIIGDLIEGQALATFCINGQRLKRNCTIIATNSPGFGPRKSDILQDIAILTGGNVISEESGLTLDNFEITDLGRADRVISDKDKTLIVGGKGKKIDIQKRIKSIQSQLDRAEVEFEKEKLHERLAKLTTGVAIVKVGAITPTEMKEKKERVIDAISATKAAMEEGIVPGGEVALIKVSKVLDKIEVEGDEKIGVDIIRQAIVQPFKRLLKNAGLDQEYNVSDVRDSKFEIGVDVMDGKTKDMIKAGIIDPVKVTLSALKNAVSIAKTVLITHVLVTDVPEEKNAKA